MISVRKRYTDFKTRTMLHIINKTLISNYLIYLKSGVLTTVSFYKRDDFHFDLVDFPLLDGDIHRSTCTSFCVCIPRIIRFLGMCSHMTEFNPRNNRIYDIINYERLSYLN